MTLPIILALWGAVLSTVLCIIKIYETYRDRSRLHVSYAMLKSGYEIMITNLGKTPLKVEYYELFWSRRPFFRKEKMTFIFSPEDPTDITISSYSTHTLEFYEEKYIRWASPTGKDKLYLNLYIMGTKRPKRLLVYEPTASYPNDF